MIRRLAMLTILGMSSMAAVVAMPNVRAGVGECTSGCTSGGSSTPTGVTVSASGDMGYTVPNVAPPNNPTPSPNPGNSSCSGAGWEYYGIGFTYITGPVMYGVNVKVVTSVGLIGNSPFGFFIYSKAPFTSLPTYPTIVSPSQNWYAAWEGTWTPQTQTNVTATYGWVETSPPVTKASYTQPAGSATTEWVSDGTIHASRQYVPLWVEYLWEQTGTTTTTSVVGCALKDINLKYFYPVTYCTTAACLAPWLPPLPPLVQGLAAQLHAGWSPGAVVSSPPAGSVTVWVPTTFYLSGGAMPPVSGVTKSKTATVTVDEYGSPRTLTIHLSVSIQPTVVNWTYTASGGQSGSGFSCTFQTYPYESVGGQNLSNCTSPDVGYASGNGYVFTHDAQHLTVTAAVLLQLSASASWTVNGSTYTETVPLGGLGSEVLTTQTPERTTVNQVEGVTQP